MSEQPRAKNAVLLINLGSPDDASIPAVRAYLNEFLMDPLVVDIPWLARFCLVKGIILRTRPKQSAEAYQKIWTSRGSPLIINSTELKDKLADAMPDCIVELGMRYGKPSIQSAVQEIMKHAINHLIVLPLFPQYARATTQSAINCFQKELARYAIQPTVKIIHDFYNDPAFISTSVHIIQSHLEKHADDFLLMSYHGLPIRQLPLNGTLANCYRAQCYETSRLIADQLQLTPNQYGVSFQSRLNGTPWIQPYTDNYLIQLSEQGIKNIVIVCPSFVADCLETLEEIGIRAQAQWRALGGNRFTLLPCLNADNAWVDGIKKQVDNIIQEAL